MIITFSDHARQQLRERGIAERQVILAVRHPTQTIPQSLTRYRAALFTPQKRKRYALVVIVDRRGKAHEVVTAFITSKLTKYL